MPTRARTLICALVLAATATLGQTTSSVRQAIDVYTRATAEAETGATPQSVESAVVAIQKLRDVLYARVPGDTRLVLEALSAEDFALLERLPGVFVRRSEILVVHPDAGYFLKLAERGGDRADRRFAAALADTYPGGYWPVYTRRQTDYSGCTLFENGKLLETYLAWSAMARDFPDRYMSDVSRERDAVADKIAASTCACGDKASVVGELERIAAALKPVDPIYALVRERLAALNDGRSDIRFGCLSG